jgi:hypothetical protein
MAYVVGEDELGAVRGVAGLVSEERDRKSVV